MTASTKPAPGRSSKTRSSAALEAFVDLFRQTLPPDRDLSMDMAFESLRDLYPDEATLLGVIRDVDRVVVVMQAATSKNRTDPIVRRQLATRGIRV